MKIEEFDQQMDRLRSNFGNNRYGSELKQILWQRFKYLADGEFTKAITELIATRSTAPLRDDIADVLEKQGVSANRSRWNPVHSDCELCGGTGWMWVVHKEIKSDGVAACDRCAAGRNYLQKPGGIKALLNRAEAQGYTYAGPGRATAAELLK